MELRPLYSFTSIVLSQPGCADHLVHMQRAINRHQPVTVSVRSTLRRSSLVSVSRDLQPAYGRSFISSLYAQSLLLDNFC